MGEGIMTNRFGSSGSMCFKRKLDNTDDMNNIVENGVYFYQTDSIPLNAPFNNAAVVMVFGNKSTTSQKIQQAFQYGESGKSKFRSLYEGRAENDGWQDWTEVAIATDGVVQIENGGTGGSTANEAEYNISGDMTESQDDITDTSQLAFKYVTPSKDQGTFYYRKMSTFWTYLAGRIRTLFGFSDNNVLSIENGGTGGTDSTAALRNLGGLSLVEHTGGWIKTDSDLNTYTTPGTYWSDLDTTATLTNCPISSGFKMIVMEGYGGERTHQIIFPGSGFKTWQRLKVSGEWVEWHYGQEIAAQGTSGIWTYVKYANGTAECWGRHTRSKSSIIWLASGDWYYDTFNINFPFTFASTPIVNVTADAVGQSIHSDLYHYGTSIDTKKAITISSTLFSTKEAVAYYVNIHVKGRWK